MRSGFGLVAGCWALGAALASEPQSAGALGGKDRVAAAVTLAAEPFPLEDVRLLDGPFKQAMELDHRYLLSLEPDRLLHMFRLGAGLPSTARPYGGWMAPDQLNIEFVGHYLSACALMYASTGDERLKAKAGEVVRGLAVCQNKSGTGFVHAKPDTFSTRCEAPLGFWYAVHKILAGLLEVYVHCDNPQALEVARKLGDWAKNGADKFSDEQIQKMLEIEHGGINEALANLYALTGERRYLDLSLRFNHRAVIQPASARQDRLTGLHANTQIPKFIGTARQYELSGDASLRTASTFFWECVVRERSYVIGGNSQSEIFTPKEHLSRALGCNTCETCNTYNVLKLTRHLFCWEPRAEYADYYERALYNHILASQDPASGMMCYYLPLGPTPGCHKEYSTPENSFWCCTGTGIENHAKYGDSIYFHNASAALYVNLFIASELNWPDRGLRLRQETGFPEQGGTRLVFQCEKPVRLTLNLRHPAWAGKGFELKVNGRKASVESQPGSFASLDRNWASGDSVEVSLPLTLRTEGFRDDPGRVAFLKGPLVLCAATEGRECDLPFPVFVPGQQELAANFEPVSGLTSTLAASPTVLRFSESGGGSDVFLEPLYRLHGGRNYVVYWDTFTPAQWEAKLEARRQQQELEARIAARTVDRVLPGNEASEQQHHIQGANTWPGEQRWRHAIGGGWFSWDLKVLPGQPQELRVKYCGDDTGGREFDVLVDGQKLATQTLDYNRPGEFYEESYPIPAAWVQGKDKVVVRFQAHSGKVAGGVFGCAIVGPELKR